MSDSTREQIATDHVDLDRLDRLADSLRDQQLTPPIERDDLDAATLAEVEELAYRFNVLGSTMLYVAQLLADEDEDVTNVYRFFDGARHDARRMGLKLPQDQAAAQEAGR